MDTHDFTYENTSEQDITLPGVGLVKAGATIHSAYEINNANLRLVQPVKEQVSEAESGDKAPTKSKAKGDK